MKKLFALSLTFILLTLIAACDVDEVIEFDEAAYYMSLDINPSVEFVLDDNETVIAFTINDEHAEILVADSFFLDLRAEEAVRLLLLEAIETGYIGLDVNDNAVHIAADKLDEQTPDEATLEFEARMRETAADFFSTRGIGVAILEESLDDALIDEAQDHGVSIARLRMMRKAAEIDLGLDFEDALALTPAEVAEIIVDTHDARIEDYNLNRRAEALERYEALVDMFAEKIEQHRFNVRNELVPIPNLEIYTNAFVSAKDVRRNAFSNRIEDNLAEADDIIDNNGNE